MDDKCLILMTTYNGAEYIREQMESIIGQSYANWSLVVRDDGSTDGTVDILKQYSQKDTRITVLENDTGKQGAYLNFWTLIHYAKSLESHFDYYLFADQDDIWLKEKIELLISSVRAEKRNMHLLAYTDMQVVDQNGLLIYESLNDIMGIGEMSGYSLMFSHGFLYGCDMMINDALFQSTPLMPLEHPLIEIMSHDNYFGKAALLFGKIRFIDKAGMKYRRHESNVTGKYSMKLSPVKVLKRAFVEFDDLSQIHARVYNQTLVLLQQLRRSDSDIEKAIRRGGIYGVSRLIKYKVKRKQATRTIGIYLVMLLGTYKKYLRV